MPAFSHFFLKRLSARSKFSSSWIMTSDKFYFPPSWRLAAPACVQIAKPSGRRGMGQANRAPLGSDSRAGDSCELWIIAGASEGGGGLGATLARAKPLTTLVRSAHSRVFWSLAEGAGAPHLSDSPVRSKAASDHSSRLRYA